MLFCMSQSPPFDQALPFQCILQGGFMRDRSLPWVETGRCILSILSKTVLRNLILVHKIV